MDANDKMVSKCERLLRGGNAEEFFSEAILLSSINQSTTSGQSLLHVAVEIKQMAAVKFLIERGANVNAQETMQLATPLHYAVSGNDLESVKALLENGANPNIVDRHGNPPLWHALLKYRSDRPDIVRPLLEAGSNIDIVNRAGMSSRMHLMRTTSDFILAPFRERGLIK